MSDPEEGDPQPVYTLSMNIADKQFDFTGCWLIDGNVVTLYDTNNIEICKLTYSSEGEVDTLTADPAFSSNLVFTLVDEVEPAAETEAEPEAADEPAA